MDSFLLYISLSYHVQSCEETYDLETVNDVYYYKPDELSGGVIHVFCRPRKN